MIIKNKHFLFELIHSLSGSEKRYISLSLKQEGVKNHYKLFIAIEKQKKSDEKDLRKILGNETFVHHLPVLKHYLYEYLLKKLNAFYYGNSSKIMLYQSLVEAEVLLKKNLYAQLAVKLSKIKGLAQKEGNSIILLACSELERKVLEDLQYEGVQSSNMDNLLRTELSLSEKIANLNRYKNLADKVSIFVFKTGAIRQSSHRKKLLYFLKNPLLRSENSALTPEAKAYFHYVRSTCYHYLQDYANALKGIDILLLQTESYIHSDENKLENHIAFLNNKILILTMMHNYKDSIATIKQLRNISTTVKKVSEAIKGKVIAHSYNQEMNLYIVSNQFENALKLIPVIEETIKKYSESIGHVRLLLFYFHFAYIHFVMGNYKKTLAYLSKILNEKRDGVYLENIYCYSKILQLLTYYEKKTGYLDKSILESVFQFLAKRKQLYKIENAFLVFVRDILLKKNISQAELNNSFRHLKNKINELQKSRYEEKVMIYFDFISWIDSKIRKKPLIEIV